MQTEVAVATARRRKRWRKRRVSKRMRQPVSFLSGRAARKPQGGGQEVRWRRALDAPLSTREGSRSQLPPVCLSFRGLTAAQLTARLLGHSSWTGGWRRRARRARLALRGRVECNARHNGRSSGGDGTSSLLDAQPGRQAGRFPASLLRAGRVPAAGVELNRRRHPAIVAATCSLCWRASGLQTRSVALQLTCRSATAL